MPIRSRVDTELVRRGLARSRTEAVDLLASGRVRVAGRPVSKPASAVRADEPLAVDPVATYVSRGGHKLAGALDALGVPVAGRRCLDAGASTGGFTDVLLRRGAAEVTAVDVGYGQLAWRLRTDPRVRVVDRTNVRDLTPGHLSGPVDLTVADLSFISLTLVLARLVAVTAPDGDLLPMVKPQFEVGRERIGPRGLVGDPAARADAVRRVAQAAGGLGWGVRGLATSPLPGPTGNVEFFLRLRRGGAPLDEAALQRTVTDPPGG